MAIQTGMISPPPPIPPLFANPRSRGRMITPAISEPFAGKTFLWAQNPFKHYENLALTQSETTAQLCVVAGSARYLYK